jgi:hypothetical protein
MRANAWEEIGKELKIKPKFYVSSRDVKIVCPRLNPVRAGVKVGKRHTVSWIFISRIKK